jgi:hypothetical protein
MKSLLSLVSAAVLFAPSLAQDPKPIPPVPAYPLKVGSKWTYKSGADTLEVSVKGVEKVEKEDVYELVTSRNGTPEANEHVVVKDDGVYRVKVAGVAVKPPLCFLKTKLKKGESWDVSSQLSGAETLAGKFTLGEAKVKYKDKEINTITVTGIDMLANSQKISLTYYFAENIGLVKQEATIAGAKITLELQKDEIAK